MSGLNCPLELKGVLVVGFDVAAVVKHLVIFAGLLLADVKEYLENFNSISIFFFFAGIFIYLY